MVLLITLLGLGCTPEDQGRFNGGGTSITPTDDTGTSDSGDTQVGDEFAIVGVEAGFEDLPNVGTAIYAFIEVTGAPGPLDDGMLKVSIDGQPIEPDGKPGIPIDNSLAWVVPDTGEVFTALQVPDPSSFQVEITVWTADGAGSEAWTGTVDSPNERDLPPKP
jgi:hypothetical protein